MSQIFGLRYKNKIRFSAKTVILVSIILITIWSFCLESNVTIYGNKPFQTLDLGWSQVVDGQRISLPVVQDAVYSENQDTIILETTVPMMKESRSLLFYATHQEVTVYVDDVCISSLACPEEMSFYGSVGRVWMDTPLTHSMEGKTLRLEITSPFPMYHTVPDTFYFVQPREIQSVQMDFMWVRNSIALAILALAGISYVNALLWKQYQLRHFIFCLADLFLFTGLWLCSEVNVLSVWIGHSAAASFLAMIFVRLIPVVFYYFIRSTMSRCPIWIRVAGVFAWVNLVVSVLCQLLFDISLVETLPIHAMVMGGSCLVYLAGMAYQFFAQKQRNLYRRAYYASAVLLVATLVEICFYINNQQLGHYNGFVISFASIIYACIAHVLLVKNESDTEVIKRILEQENRSLENRPLNQQINAHFLFNTLNMVRGYCKEDPQKADQAVEWLAQYMRGYMRHINSDAYVAFPEALLLIQRYLNIQNLRFEEEISLETDIGYDAFVLPPLTLQPLVENSVNHGIHGYVDKGVVRVSTELVGDMVKLIVSDNGCGFNWNERSNGRVGLDNLIRRIRAMGGQMRVESAKGEGTRVILNIPLVPTKYEKKGIE